MKLRAGVNGVDHQVNVDLSEREVNATVDDRSYVIEARELGNGEYLINLKNTLYRCRVELAKGSASFQVSVRGREFAVSIIDPKRLRSGQLAGAHDHGTAEIVSPMPGKVVRVLVKAGASVDAGDGIVVVEAMKMQNELKAPKKGVVISIEAIEGATVNAGDVLAIVE